jgi:hypothetical protein
MWTGIGGNWCRWKRTSKGNGVMIALPKAQRREKMPLFHRMMSWWIRSLTFSRPWHRLCPVTILNPHGLYLHSAVVFHTLSETSSPTFPQSRYPWNRITANAFWSSALAEVARHQSAWWPSTQRAWHWSGQPSPPALTRHFETSFTPIEIYTIHRNTGQRWRLAVCRGWSFPQKPSQLNPNLISKDFITLCVEIFCIYWISDLRYVLRLTSSSEQNNPFHHRTQFDLHQVMSEFKS